MKLQFEVCQIAHGSVAYLDKHSTLDPVMVSVVSSNPTGSNLLNFFKSLDVYFGLKCKCDLIMKNSIALQWKRENLVEAKQPKFTETSTPPASRIRMYVSMESNHLHLYSLLIITSVLTSVFFNRAFVGSLVSLLNDFVLD